jgi:dTDP-4-dehydrorhamnose 3,5-epimerase
MDVKELDLKGVLLLRPKRWEDPRGYFVETYNQRTFANATGLDVAFVQDNESFSRATGTVRALHFQLPPVPQAKLVRVLRGSVYDVAVDVRAGSPTYGRWTGAKLDAEGGEQLFVPRGFAHGFCTLEPDTIVAYKVDNLYSGPQDSGLAWNDPEIGVAWPVAPERAVLSDKDRKLGAFKDFVSPFPYGG